MPESELEKMRVLLGDLIERVEALEAKTSKQRAKAIPKNWRPSPVVMDQLASECPRVDLEAEIIKMRDWAEFKGVLGVNWDARFRAWVRNSQSFAEAHKVTHVRGSANPFIAMMEDQ